MLEIKWFDVVGTVGVVMILATYILLQTEKLRADGLAYSVLNGTGAALIAFSLLFKFNLAAMVVEVAWVAISLFGIVRYFLKRNKLGNHG